MSKTIIENQVEEFLDIFREFAPTTNFADSISNDRKIFKINYNKHGYKVTLSYNNDIIFTIKCDDDIICLLSESFDPKLFLKFLIGQVEQKLINIHELDKIKWKMI